ncbi:MAG: methylamine utilization protein [Vicinamibacterales bacterium]
MTRPSRAFTVFIGAASALALSGTPSAQDGSDSDRRGPVTGVVRLDGRPQKEVVLWLSGIDAPAPPPSRVVLDQRNLTFTPRILVVQTGTRVDMPNSDRVFHNVFSFKDGKRFDLGVYPAGHSRSVLFDRPGVSRLFCNIHPDMAAYIVAVDSPFHAVSDAAGRFTLPPLPPGRHVVHAWRAGHDEVTGTLVVTGDEPVSLDLR